MFCVPACRRPFVRAACPEDVEAVAADLRPADAAELTALGWTPAGDGVRASYAASSDVFAIDDGAGRALAVFGVGPIDAPARIGAPWLLGARGLGRHGRALAAGSRRWTDRLQREYALLVNIVDARNHAAIRWLDWCGFTFLRRIDAFGPESRPFYEFVRAA